MHPRHGLIVLLSLLTGCAGMRIRSASDKVEIVENIHYEPGSSNAKHQLDLYVPRGAREAPVVVFVHGGFWRNQDRRYYQAFTGLYGSIGVQLARRGSLVAVPSYRLSPDAGIEEQLDDVLASIRWVSDHAREHGGDPTRIVLAGYSAGGHLVTMIALDRTYLESAKIDPAHVRGVVSLSGILDVPAMAAGQDADFNEDVTFRLFGRTAAEQGRLSPSTHLRADAPPMLVLAAERDYPFVLSAGKSTVAKLTELGGKATFQEIPKYDHSDMVLEVNTSHDRITDRVATFIAAVTRP